MIQSFDYCLVLWNKCLNNNNSICCVLPILTTDILVTDGKTFWLTSSIPASWFKEERPCGKSVSYPYPNSPVSPSRIDKKCRLENRKTIVQSVHHLIRCRCRPVFPLIRRWEGGEVKLFLQQLISYPPWKMNKYGPPGFHYGSMGSHNLEQQ